MEILPPLRRDIDIVPITHEGQSCLLVRDPLGIARSDLALNPQAAQIFPFFDGTHSLEELQNALVLPGGASGEEAASLVRNFDELGLLESERYVKERQKIVEAFTAGGRRPASLAGSAYPAEAEELGALVDDILGESKVGEVAAGIRAVAAPHIDLRVSKRAYGLAYGSLSGLAPSALLVLGTGHSLAEPYSLSEKTFETPLGSVPADVDTVRRFRRSGGDLFSDDDFAHRQEHSIEFQLLFLQRIFPMEKIPFVPLLCGPFDQLFPTGRTPLEIPQIAAFIAEVRTWLLEPPAGKTIVAGVDLSHVGPKFGDDDNAVALEEGFRAFDSQVLSALESGDAEAFFRLVAAAGNRYRICGFSALWTLLALLPGAKGRTLDYQVWHEEATNSAVSFAAVSFS